MVCVVVWAPFIIVIIICRLPPQTGLASPPLSEKRLPRTTTSRVVPFALRLWAWLVIAGTQRVHMHRQKGASVWSAAARLDGVGLGGTHERDKRVKEGGDGR